MNINTLIKINNRKILTGLADISGESGRITDITVAIDKIDKIGLDAVIDELKGKGVSETAINKLKPVLNLKGDTDVKLKELENILAASVTGLQGISELYSLFGFIGKSSLNSSIELDLTLARGLNYYTGAIIEVKSKDINIGSICGGGRYDDLTGIFGMQGVSGVGVSFGADRIYDVLMHLDRFDIQNTHGQSVMLVNFGDNEMDYNLKILDTIQKLGISAELYPETVKIKKQMAYADSKKITYVLIAGEDEIKNNQVTIKNMQTSEQVKTGLKELVSFFK